MGDLAFTIFLSVSFGLSVGFILGFKLAKWACAPAVDYLKRQVEKAQKDDSP